jgi:hypothetical protein
MKQERKLFSAPDLRLIIDNILEEPYQLVSLESMVKEFIYSVSCL